MPVKAHRCKSQEEMSPHKVKTTQNRHKTIVKLYFLPTIGSDFFSKGPKAYLQRSMDLRIKWGKSSRKINRFV